MNTVDLREKEGERNDDVGRWVGGMRLCCGGL